MSDSEFTINRPAKDPDEYRKYVDEITHPGISRDRVMDLYSGWASSYDQDVNRVEYNPPKHGAQEVAEVLRDRKDAKILDCAAGTGLVGEELKKRGYTNVDALDASAEMLEKAKQKSLYGRLICDYMGPNKLDISNDTYDALVAVGCFCAGHVGSDCFEELIRITKPGGYIVIALKESRLVTDFKENELEGAMQRHHDNQLWKWVTRKVVPDYHEDESGVIYQFLVI